MDYLFKLRSAVSTVTNTVNSVIPGNPVTREYEVGEQIASAGPGLVWKIYSGKKHSTQQAVAVWVLEKKDIERWPKREKDMMMELVKKGVSQLTRLRHPRMLTVEHALEESRDSLAFCTEPVYGSLANVLGRVDNINGAVPPHIAEFKFEPVEIKHGLFQIAEALTFLNNDARMCHRNLCPEGVILNDKGSWKLAGFDFTVTNAAQPGQPADFPPLEWTSDIMSVVQPVLDYVAPELVVGGRVDTSTDLFSLGVLCFAVFNRLKTPTQNQNSIPTFKKNASELKSLPPSLLRGIPETFRDDVKMCLNLTPDLRPDANQFSKISYFDDPLVKTLNYLESLCQMDNAQKSQFFKGLPNVLNRFPKRPMLQKILPFLTAEFKTPELIPFILPNVFYIAEQATENEFAATILPPLTPVFRIQRPFQISLMLLQNMELLLNKTPEAEIKAHLLPLIYGALDSDTSQIQELCLTIVPKISHLVDRDSMKSQLLPKLMRLAQSAPVLSVKVNSLLCIGRLLEKLEKWMVMEQVLPMLPKTNSKEPGVLMAVLGIYKLAFQSRQLGIPKEVLAKNAIPFLVTSSVESSLNLQQFEAFITLTKTMLAKVEEEQRSRLQQLSAMQEEQRAGVQDFNSVLNQANAKQTIPKELHGLEAIAEIQNGQSKGMKGTGPLSLEEKRRLAKEQEDNLRMRNQKPLAPAGGGAGASKGKGPPAVNSAFAKSVENNPLDMSFLNSMSSPSSAASPQQGMTMAPGGGGGMMGVGGNRGGGGMMSSPAGQASSSAMNFGAAFGSPSPSSTTMAVNTNNSGGGMSNFGGRSTNSSSSSLNSMQPWASNAPRLGPPPGPQSFVASPPLNHQPPMMNNMMGGGGGMMRPPGGFIGNNSVGSSSSYQQQQQQAPKLNQMDLSAFDGLCSFGAAGGNSTTATNNNNNSRKGNPSNNTNNTKPKPAGANGDLNDFLG